MRRRCLPTVPAPLRWIIERLLAKDPSERYDSSRDLYRELKQLRDRLSDATAPVSGVTAAVSAAPVPASRTRSWLPLVAAVAVAVAVTAGLAWTLWPRSTGGAVDLSTYRFTPLSLEAASELEPAWSPDGRSLAYTAAVDGVPQLMVREVGGTAVQLTRTVFARGGPPSGRPTDRAFTSSAVPVRPLLGECGGRGTGAGDRRCDIGRHPSARWSFRVRPRRELCGWSTLPRARRRSRSVRRRSPTHPRRRGPCPSAWRSSHPTAPESRS